MEELEHIVSERGNKGFIKDLKRELLSTGELYIKVARRPSLLARGMYSVAKDILYELPKSFMQKSGNLDLERRLNERSSQALALSELATVPGTYAGVYVFKMLGADDYTASVIGGSIGNYISGVLSYITAYTLLTRNNKGYSMGTAFKDASKVVKDCFPAVLALYASAAPIISGLLAIGVPRNLALGLNLAASMAIFTSIDKYSSTENISLHKDKEVKKKVCI